MAVERLTLDPDPAKAVEALRSASRTRPVVVFKKSPICPISRAAETEFEAWLATLGPQDSLAWAVVDVIAERALARGLTAALEVQHQSPQALWFEGGELRWHASHSALTRERFARR
jgi:bacillithiol system protein YtxJ